MKPMQTKPHVLILLILISCADKAPVENTHNLETNYTLEYTDYVTGEKEIFALTTKQMLEIRKKAPILAPESCLTIEPDRLYGLYLKEISKTEEDEFTSREFAGEAGRDEFYLISALIMQKEVNMQLENSSGIRSELQSVLININMTFRCVSNGGTMYYHMYQRIPAYTEWYLLRGIENGFTVQHMRSHEDIKKKIAEVCESYKDNFSVEQISLCITPLIIDGKNEYRYWLLEKAYDFISKYK
jgi:hypothetical protein